MKKMFIIQPYLVGSKKSKSLALIIPAEVARRCHIDISSAFALTTDSQTSIMTLHQIESLDLENKEKGMPAEQCLETPTQQVSFESQ